MVNDVKTLYLSAGSHFVLFFKAGAMWKFFKGHRVNSKTLNRKNDSQSKHFGDYNCTKTGIALKFVNRNLRNST